MKTALQILKDFSLESGDSNPYQPEDSRHGIWGEIVPIVVSMLQDRIRAEEAKIPSEAELEEKLAEESHE